jgi:hypothetical protein
MNTDQTNHNDDTNERAGSRRTGGLRASDADREAMAKILRQHYSDGRLDAQEYDERINHCYAAKTVRELDELLLDLPRLKEQEPEHAPEHAYWGRRPLWWPATFVALVVALIAISALTGAHIVWLAFPLAFFVFRPFGRWCGPYQGRRRGTGTR